MSGAVGVERRTGTTPAQAHRGGWYDEMWIYYVLAADRQTALRLMVGSGIYPPEYPHDRTRDREYDAEKNPRAAYVHDLSFYTAWPTDREQLLAGPRERDVGCLEMAEVYLYTTTALGGPELARAAGYDWRQLEQAESFWRTLEAKFAAWDADARELRDALAAKRCEACGATGTVAVPRKTPMASGRLHVGCIDGPRAIVDALPAGTYDFDVLHNGSAGVVTLRLRRV